MNKDLTCNQVSALINFYIEGKLNPRLAEYVELHIAKCPVCRKKIEDLQKILTSYKSDSTTGLENSSTTVVPELRNRLSAYVDNELNLDENIKIKKLTISNPVARKELETIYKYQKVIQSAYNKTKNDSKIDFSKAIMNKIQDNTDYSTTYFYKILVIFGLLIMAIISGFVYLYL